ncbi:MAG: hypothetical protein IPI35_32010 [Deltaproteobacteria bacterium]|nr:hypothetical protein [Deltaproteobacteria bacterium]
MSRFCATAPTGCAGGWRWRHEPEGAVGGAGRGACCCCRFASLQGGAPPRPSPRPPPRPPSPATWAPALAAVTLSVALTVERLGGALSAPGRVLVGDWHHPDCLGNHWLLVWVAERLSSGQSLVHNDSYYWPIGDAPWIAGNGSEGLLYLPFHLLWGWPVGVAAYAGAVWVGNGLAGWALGRAAGAGPWAALVCAAGVGSSAYAAQEMGSGRFSQANLIFLVGGLAAWLTLLHSPSKGRVVRRGRSRRRRRPCTGITGSFWRWPWVR